MATQGRYTDSNALQFGASPAEIRGRATHVAKHKKRNKGLHVVFDPAARQCAPISRKYVGGFRQRKLERKENAKKCASEFGHLLHTVQNTISHLRACRAAEIKAKKQRIEDRAARRAKQRKELNLDQFDSDKEEGADPPIDTLPEQDAELPSGAAKSGPATVQHYVGSGVRTTVSIAPISLHSSSEEEQSDGDSGAEAADTTPAPVVSEQQQPPIAAGQSGALKKKAPARSQRQKRRQTQKSQQQAGKKQKRPRR